jgi:hypothetical protein
VRSAVEQQQRLVKVWSPASTAERSFPSKLGQENLSNKKM